MVIVKDNANKEVSFYRNGIVVQTLTEDCTANLNKRRNGILIEDKRGRKFEVITNQVDEINIKFGASFKFLGGSTLDLWNRLFDPTYSYFNELHIFTSSGGGGVVTLFTIQSTNYSAINGDYVDMTTGATDKTVTLPASPAIDDIIDVAKADSGSGRVIIDANGGTINGNSTVIIKKQYTSITMQYNGSEWRIK